ncbi:ATP-binding Cassette (ABC) Superfamily [Thraustotheca clavata]|uniref:ATP-binding Cassette (ABC) Superfamily n=1 Tax=Thraustotheca clavata TaxID=74557 RepID=A0A1V9YTW7_9STRA|nr:ATP-binding Cassette (ABC) Superfamily [Thraustotheca clavata]
MTPQSANDFLQHGSEVFHASLAAKLEASRGQPMPQVEIRYQDLSISATVAVATKDGNELPTLYNHAKKLVMGLFNSKRSINKRILHPMSGVFKPSTITLVLGQPGSGKSTLMKVLCEQFPKQNITMGGTMTYNGENIEQVATKLPQLAVYIDQRDFHYPTLSVQETLEFAHACAGGAQVPEMILKSLQYGSPEENAQAKAFIQSLYNVYPDIVTRQFGLDICKNTIIGNGMLRGVSGGERKRVTIGEMEFGMKMASFMDEISTGLDSAATYDIVKAQKSLAVSLKKTIVISLLQPSPEVFNLFDEVLLLNDGHVMYHGPRALALEYFESLGFQCPPDRDVADFLLDLGTSQQNQYVVDPSSATTPRTPSDYSYYFKKSEIYSEMMAIVQGPLLHCNDANYVVGMPSFQIDYFNSTKLLIRRQMKVFLRNKAFVKSRFIMILLMGLLYSSTFYNVDPENPVVVLGVLFTPVLFLVMGQVPMMPAVLEARNIYYKQRSANFFRTSSFILAQSFTQIPFALAETIVFGSIMYWISGFVADAVAFTTYLLILFLTNLSFTAWFFFLAVVSPDLHVAKPVSMLTVLIFMLFAGFVISPSILPDYFIWIYWIDPLSWCIRGLAINQYSASEFQQDTYKDTNYKINRGMTMGNTMLKVVGLQTEKNWIWYAVIYLVVSYVFFLGLAYLALEYKKYDTPENVKVSPDSDQKDNNNYGKAPKTPTNMSESTRHVKVHVAGSSSSSPPVTLAFKDLSYSVPNSTKGEPDIQLLKGISGYALPGTITALMGSSGAGKTTLMDVIAGRKTGGKITGEILLNSFPATNLAIQRATGYCEQMDIHSESATFREAFQFSAMLRQSDDIPGMLKRWHLLTNRLTIGVELAAAPSILFLDEPTSGLDARSAKIIMSGIRKIASTGRTVICTIHQPSAEVFDMFDNLLLLKRGGETVFFGDLGPHAVNMINYFKSIPNTPPLIQGANPAAWMLEAIGAGVETKQDNLPPVDFVEEFNNSEERRCLDQQLSIYSSPNSTAPELTYGKKRAASSTTQFKMVTQRFFRMYWRTPSYNFTRAMISPILAILFGLVYRGVDYGTYIGANGGVGMIFMTSLFIGMISFNSVLPLASEERASFYRERASQTYSALWYFVGSTLAEIPYVFATTIIFTIIFYPFVGLNESVGACLFYGFNLSLMVLMYVYLGQLMSYAAPRVDIAALIGVLLNSIFILFMGYNPPSSQIPSGYRWLYHITPPKYSIALLVAETLAKCTDGTELGCQIMPSEGIPLSLTRALNKTNITVQDYIEYNYQMKFDERWKNFFAVIGFILLLRLLALFCLRYINHQKR